MQCSKMNAGKAVTEERSDFHRALKQNPAHLSPFVTASVFMISLVLGRGAIAFLTWSSSNIKATCTAGLLLGSTGLRTWKYGVTLFISSLKLVFMRTLGWYLFSLHIALVESPLIPGLQATILRSHTLIWPLRNSLTVGLKAFSQQLLVPASRF